MFNQKFILDAMHKNYTLQELPGFARLLKTLEQEQDLDQRSCIANDYFYGIDQCDDSYYGVFHFDDIIDQFDYDEALERAFYAHAFKVQYHKKYWG